MRTVGTWRLFTVVVLAAGVAAPAIAQEPEAPTRQAAIEQEQREKAQALHPYVPGRAEAVLNRFGDILANGVDERGELTQYYGTNALDATVDTLPAVRFTATATQPALTPNQGGTLVTWQMQGACPFSP